MENPSGQPPELPPVIPAASEPPRSSAPPAMPPPFPIQRPAARKTGRGWMITSILLLAVLGFSLIGNFFQAIGSAASSVNLGLPGRRSRHHAGSDLMENVVRDNNSRNKIAIVGVEGVITSSAIDPSGLNMVDLIREQLEMAAKDDAVKAVLLKVDSPGGEVLASDEVYKLLQDFQKGPSGKPVIASMGNLAASGGYYVSAPCRWIVANELTMTGSIGVIMHGYNYRGLMDKVGVRPLVFKSGKFKDMLSGEKTPAEETREEMDLVQSMVMETYEKFRGVVREGRESARKANAGADDEADTGRALSKDWTDYADGRILSGRVALEHGFVDELGNLEVAVKRALKIAEIRDADLVAYESPFKFGNFLRFFGQTPAKGIKVDLGLDVPKLPSGRLYFIAPTLMP